MINKVFLAGFIGKDAYVNDTGKYASFSIACSERYIDKSGDPKRRTTFVQVKCFGGAVKVAQQLKKGMLVTIQGKIAREKWKERWDTTIVADCIVIAKEKADPTEDMAYDYEEREDGSIPF